MAMQMVGGGTEEGWHHYSSGGPHQTHPAITADAANHGSNFSVNF